MVIEHISIEAITADQWTKRLEPKLINEHAVSMAVLSSFDILGNGNSDCISFYLAFIILGCKPL